MVIRFQLLGILFLSVLTTQAGDTLQLRETLILERRQHANSIHQLEDYTNKPVSNLLNEISSVYLRNYGLAQLSGISYRGTSTAQSDLQWNGMSLNSPLHGQSDLSIIQSGLFDRIKLVSGSSSAIIGACIQLENKPVFGEGFKMGTRLNGGSFMQIANSVRVEFSSARYYVKAFGLVSVADNNYPFRDKFHENQPDVKLKNADARTISAGLDQAFAWSDKDTIQLFLQFRQTSRGIPNVSQTGEQMERQTDKTGGLFVQYTRRIKNARIELKHAWLPAYLKYINPLSAIHAVSYSHVWRNHFNWYLRHKKINLGGGFHGDVEQARGKNYTDSKVNRMRLGLSQFAEFSVYKNLIAHLELKEEVVGHVFSLPLPYVSLKYSGYKSGWLAEGFVSGSGKFRAATLNDLFWQGAGNQQIRNEMAWCGELGGQLKWKNYFAVQLRMYLMRVQNQIVWTPNSSGFWQPGNESNVRTRGIESEIWIPVLHPVKRKGFGLQGSISYAYNRSTFRESDKEFQLIYAPVHRAVASVIFNYKKFVLKGWMPVTGKRFVSRSNTESLPAFYTLNLETSYAYRIKDVGLSVFCRMYNLTDNRYEEVMMRPMPGRYFEAGFNFTYR